MVNADGTTGGHSLRSWGVSLLLIAAGAIYMSAFWGGAALYLPKPLDAWSMLPRGTLAAWYRRRVGLWLAAQFVLGLGFPALLLRLSGRRLSDVGFSRPNALGWRLVLISAVISVPFGLWLLAAAYADLVRAPAISRHYLCGLISMVPEHFLICGVYVAILLPQRRLPVRVPMARASGSFRTGLLRWLGLAQPARPRTCRVLAWFGLTGTSLFAILVSGMLFAMVHVGKAPAELALSLPGGVAVAYVTLRSRSIWPAVFAHWTMNLVPLVLLRALR